MLIRAALKPPYTPQNRYWKTSAVAVDEDLEDIAESAPFETQPALLRRCVRALRRAGDARQGTFAKAVCVQRGKFPTVRAAASAAARGGWVDPGTAEIVKFTAGCPRRALHPKHPEAETP